MRVATAPLRKCMPVVAERAGHCIGRTGPGLGDDLLAVDGHAPRMNGLLQTPFVQTGWDRHSPDSVAPTPDPHLD